MRIICLSIRSKVVFGSMYRVRGKEVNTGTLKTDFDSTEKEGSKYWSIRNNFCSNDR